MATATSSGGASGQNATMSQTVSSLYPDALKRTYCVPPVHFKKVPYVRITVPGTDHPALLLDETADPAHPNVAVHTAQSSQPGATSSPAAPQHQQSPQQCSRLWPPDPEPQAVPEKFQPSDAQADIAQQFVLTNLQELGNDRDEVMFIVSQLDYGNYLNKPSYAACFPKPTDLDEKHKRGDFDVLVIHRHFGVLIGEIKSVGVRHAGVEKTEEAADADVVKRVQTAIRQLDKSEKVVKHLLKDIAPGLVVRKALILPFVSSADLQRVLDATPQLEQALCRSLAAANGVDVRELCVCSDRLSDPGTYWQVTPAVLSQLGTWWQKRMACTIDHQLNDQLYLDIVARFVGPASTVAVHCNIPPRVEVRTDGEAVSELGQRLAYLVLTSQQVGLMNRGPPKLCVSGPPGTGKTIVLVLMGLRWLRQGHDVYVFSPYPESRAASYMIRHQLLMTLRESHTASTTTAPGDVKLQLYDFHDGEAEFARAVEDLSKAAQGGTLRILMDEAGFGSSTVRQDLKRLIAELTARVPGLYFWASCIDRSPFSPELESEVFALPLRCAPVIVREVQSAFRQLSHLQNYVDSSVPAPGDGMKVRRLRHHGNGHCAGSPVECFQCGQEVAKELRNLGVGAKEGAVAAAVGVSPTLHYRDIFVLTRSSKLQDDVADDAGKVTSPACGFVQGLRAECLPFCVLGQKDKWRDRARWEKDVADTAEAFTDRMTVAHITSVFGLERKVVVWLPGKDEEFDEGLSKERIEAGDRLVIVSRGTTQLIVVEDVPSGDGDEGEHESKSADTMPR